MNKQHLFVRFSLCFLVLFSILPLYAQIEVSVNQSDAIYEVGETAFFQAKATYSSPATYEIIYDDKSPVIESGTINLVAGQTYSIPYNQNEPGLVICRVNLNNAIGEASAVFSPLDISPLEEEPNDFDAFWASQRNLKNNLPMDMQMSYHNESSYQTTYTFSLANIEGRRTYGYISIPKGSGPFPASITLPPYGSSRAVVGADTESAEKGGMIAVSISIHNSSVNQDDPNAYKPDDNTDKDKFYYRYGLIGAMHVIDYLETRSDFDGNVCAMGVSQGGGLSIILAGIDNRVSLLINSNPTMGQHVGYKYDKASGFPYYLSIIDAQNQGNSNVFNTAVNATKYYDAMFHARRFKGASFSLTGLKDLVVPSATALVSHNQLPGSKVLMISRDGGHNHPNEYWNGRFEFMRRHFAGSNNPPFQFGDTNKGFLADAGNDQTVGTSANLNGELFYDTNQLTNSTVFWRKVSGPGNVNFSNANGYNTSANFSTNGTYVLQFVARDDRKLASEGKIYYISDDVTVTASGGGNPTFTLNLACPSNQSIELSEGQSQTTVFWDEPTAISNCSGGANYFQLAGQSNGSAFFEGNYTISYRATDNCGNTQDCSFTINITQAQTQPSDIDLNCPSDIIIDAAPGDNEVTVSWATPTASTTCSTGGNTGGGDCSSTFKSGYAYMGTFDNSQFYISNNNANWIDASAAAISAGGRLAIINDAAENDFIQQNINNEIVFIGLSDVDQEGNLRWVDGSSVGYSKYVNNLDNNNDNDFVTIYPWNGEWDLNNQFVAKKYVLEIPCSNGGGGNNDNDVTITQTGGASNGSNFSVGTTTVTYTATDNCGNTSICSFNVIVNGSTANLSINCPNDMSVQIPGDQASMSITWNAATATSNCNGGATVTNISGRNSGDQFEAGNYTITYQATDNCGNQEVCSFSINVTNTPTDLSINCPADRIFQIPAGQTQIQASWDIATAASDCPNGASVTQIGGPDNFSQLSAGTYTITYEATDNCGNLETCAFEVSVNETATNLAINCPSNQTINIPADENSVLLTWIDPTTSTNCPNGATVNQIGGTPKFNIVGAGTYTITYEATDNCGNRETCAFEVNVVETATNLSINCPGNQTINIPADQSDVMLTWTDPTAVTNCPNGTSVNQTGGTPKQNIVGAGTYVITYEATDNCGNTATCSFEITVNQTQSNLTVNCPSDQTIQLPAGESTMSISWTNPTANTDCPSSATVNQIGGPSAGSNQSEGVYTIAYEATDNCGNTATCSFIITIEASTPVGGSEITINCANDIFVEIPYDESATNIDWATPTTSTTCVLTGGGTTCSGTVIDGYSYLGEFEGSQYYKSNDPLSFPLALTAVSNAGGILAKISSAEENEFLRQNIGSDLCVIGLNDAATEGEWRWTDGTTPSYLNFPANINNNPSDDYAVINFWNGEWELTTDFIYKKYILEIPCTGGNDNMASEIQLAQIEGPASGSNFGVGTTSITYEAMDECGNITTCSFNVVITQANPPNNDAGPPTVVISVTNTTVTDDFQVTINFNEPVTSLSGYDLAISNANWYNFTEMNGTSFTVMLDPINAGDVMIAVPANVAFDSDIQGNEASNNVVVNYNPNGADDGSNNNLPPSMGSCLLQPVSVTLEDGSTVGGAVSNIINGLGLTGADDLTAQHGGGNLYDGVWLNDGTDVTVRFDLGQVQNVDGIALWNYSYHTWLVLKRRGVKNFQVSTSEDGNNYSTPTFHTAISTTGRGEQEVVQTFNFPGVSARYIRLRILNAIDDSFYVGLGEVRLMNNCSIPPNAGSNQLVANTDLTTTLLAISIPPVELEVYPNPTSDFFFVDFGTKVQTKARIEVINEIGARVYEQQVDKTNLAPIQINLRQEADGLYLIRILIDDELPIFKKVVKTSR